MVIKFDKFELLEFFEKDPVCVGEYNKGIWLYTLEIDGFKLVAVVEVYKANVELSISYLENIVYKGRYKNVKEIKKSDDKILRLIIEEENSIILKKEKQIGVIMEES